MSKELVVVKKLKKYFPINKGIFGRKVGDVRSVDDVSFVIKEGETLALVGESGCGKTTLGRTLLSLYKPTSGEVFFNEKAIFSLSAKKIRQLRSEMQIIFQDPYGSLNPRMTVGEIVEEGIRVHRPDITSLERRKKTEKILQEVGLSVSHYNRYPHEFSGGQRQRVGIARAISVDPRFIVCDEAVSALDLSVQAKIINLLIKLRDRLNLSYLFIAHDLTVVRHIADRVAVLYLGRLVEEAETEEIFTRPLHPYTCSLLQASPPVHPRERGKDLRLKGDVPSPINPPSGCPFHPRCAKRMDICNKVFPGEHKEKKRRVFCHLYDES